MKIRLLNLFLLMCALVFQAPAAHAVISCNLSSSGWITSYFTTATTNTTGTASVTINCTRAATDPATQTYALEDTSDLYGTGSTFKASSGAATISFNEYQDAAFTTLWGTKTKSIQGTINFGTGTVASVNIPFYYSITALQAVAAGNYTDTVTMTLMDGTTGHANTLATNTHSILIIIDPTCTLNTAPGNLSFNYTSFQASNATASTSFTLTCTNLLPFTAGLDVYSATDTTTNVAYTLNVGQSILPSGAIYTAGAALSATGSGLAQTISIDGSIAAGQAGTCATGTCSGSTTRTLTITY
jgi:spore coat protein U-like protein